MSGKAEEISQLAALGDLHDAEVSSVAFDLLENKLRLFIADVNANFRGLPEYVGLQAGCLVFDDVESVSVEVAPAGATIYEVLSVSGEIRILFSPAGRVVVKAGGVRVLKLP